METPAAEAAKHDSAIDDAESRRETLSGSKERLSEDQASRDEVRSNLAGSSLASLGGWQLQLAEQSMARRGLPANIDLIDGLTIGRAATVAGVHTMLHGGPASATKISRRHVQIMLLEGSDAVCGTLRVDGLNGCTVDGAELKRGATVELHEGSTIILGSDHTCQYIVTRRADDGSSTLASSAADVAEAGGANAPPGALE